MITVVAYAPEWVPWLLGFIQQHPELAETASAGWGPTKPIVSNPKLATIVNELYRPGATIGNGGTADAVRAGVGHVQKAQDYAIALSNWLTANPNASSSDVHVAQTMLTDLVSALAGEPYPGAK